MTFTNYQIINSLEEFPMIAGNSYTLTFNVFEEDGVNPVDLGGATCSWALSPYGQPEYNILQKTGTITGTNVFKISLLTSDTQSLSGKYIQQPIVVSFLGETYRPAQGLISVISQIPLS